MVSHIALKPLVRFYNVIDIASIDMDMKGQLFYGKVFKLLTGHEFAHLVVFSSDLLLYLQLFSVLTR